MSEDFLKPDPYSWIPIPHHKPLEVVKPKSIGTGSTGTLTATIYLAKGKNPTFVLTGPFYLFSDLPGESTITGATNLLARYGLDDLLEKEPKSPQDPQIGDSLSSFLPYLPGQLPRPGRPGPPDNSSLRSIVRKPPVGGRALLPLDSEQLAGFRLRPGRLPQKLRALYDDPPMKKRLESQKQPLLYRGKGTLESDAEIKRKLRKLKKEERKKRSEEDNDGKQIKKKKRKKKKLPNSDASSAQVSNL